MPRYRVLIGADEDVGAWVAARLSQSWSTGLGRAIGFTRDQTLVAGVVYSQYNGTNVWTGIASDEVGWCSRKHLRFLFDYPFSQLNAQRITALIDASNSRSIDFTTRLGFSYEATLCGSAPDGGDQLIYRMTAEECRWLRERKREHSRRRQAA
jgi:RimJ/RimL family protein N-acetyltransferase